MMINSNVITVALLFPALVLSQSPGNPPCYLCGDADATLNLPNAVIPIPPEYNTLGFELTCSQGKQFGETGFVEVGTCDILNQNLAQVQLICGCSNYVAPQPTPQPTVSPTTEPPVVTTPSPTTATPVIPTAPTVSPTTTPPVSTSAPDNGGNEETDPTIPDDEDEGDDDKEQETDDGDGTTDKEDENKDKGDKGGEKKDKDGKNKDDDDDDDNKGKGKDKDDDGKDKNEKNYKNGKKSQKGDKKLRRRSRGRNLRRNS